MIKFDIIIPGKQVCCETATVGNCDNIGLYWPVVVPAPGNRCRPPAPYSGANRGRKSNKKIMKCLVFHVPGTIIVVLVWIKLLLAIIAAADDGTCCC